MQHPEFKALAHNQPPDAQRLALVQSSLAEVELALGESRFVQALGAFREAANLSREFVALREIVCNSALEQARQLTSRNWRVAESLLSEAAQLDSSLAVGAPIWQGIHREQRQESIGNVLAEVARAEASGTLPAVRQRLAVVLANYPGEARLESRLKSIDALLLEKRRREEAEAKERALAASQDRVRDNQQRLKAAAARAREFEKSELFAEALEQLQLIRTIDPRYPGLESEIARCTGLSNRPSANSQLPAQPPAAVEHPVEEQVPPISSEIPAQPPAIAVVRKLSVWNLAKIQIAIAASLLLAGLGLWTSRHPQLFSSSKPTAIAVAVAQPETGTLIVESTVPNPDLFVNNRKYTGPSAAGMLAIALPPNTYEVRANRHGYSDYGPVQVSVERGAETKIKLQLNPKLASLEIHGALLGTHVKVDGAPLAVASSNKTVALDLAPGNHLIELSKDGFVPKTIKRRLAPGETILLASSDVRLQSTSVPAPSLNILPPELNSLAKQSAPSLQLQPLLSAPPDGPPSAQPPAPIPSEQAAWQTANLLDRSSLENYTTQFPSGSHFGEAEQALAHLRTAELLRQESAEVLTVLRQYADAWSTKDLDSIVALHRNLDRRVVKAQLSPVKALVMRIAPASDPRIDGVKATVPCRRQVVEIFSDGIEKQSPEALVTFVLTKRNGAWTIESTR